MLILKLFLPLVFSLLSSLVFARGEGAFRVSPHAGDSTLSCVICESLHLPDIQPRGRILHPSIQPEAVQERAHQSLFNLEALTHHLKCNLVRGGVQAAADLVTGDKVDGLDLLKNAATNTIVDALGEHLAREIKSDYLREKFGAVEHKVLHGALGAFSGALLNPDDPLHGAASGAIGAFVAETAAEALAGQQTSYALNEYIDECGRNGTVPTQDGFYDRMVDVVVNHPHRDGLVLRGNIAKVVGAAGALFAGYDPDIAFRTANNCIENNFLNFLVPAIALGSVAWAGYEVHQAYKIDGPEAALKTLGIEVGTAVIGGAVVKGAFKIGQVGYRTSAEAIGAVLEARPGLRVALGKLTDVLSGYVVKAGSSKIGRGVAAVGAKVESVLQAVKCGITVKGLTWGRGIKNQGLPWEDHLEKILPSGSRLPKNFKTFDFYDRQTKTAISAKTLDTQTAARLGNPKQVYSSLRKNIDDAAKFKGKVDFNGSEVIASKIKSREVYVAIPNKTTAAQWSQINRAIEYGKTKNILVKITEIN